MEAIHFESTVLSWSESSRAGAKAVLQIHPDDLSKIKALIGKQVLLVVVPIGEDAAGTLTPVSLPGFLAPAVIPAAAKPDEPSGDSAISRAGGFKSLTSEVAWLVQRGKEPEFHEFTRYFAMHVADTGTFSYRMRDVVADQGYKTDELRSRAAWIAYFGVTSRNEISAQSIKTVMQHWNLWLTQGKPKFISNKKQTQGV